MPVKSIAVSRVSRGEYEQLVHRGHAGTAQALDTTAVLERWRADHPDWRGRHWTFVADDHGVLRLRPLNVTRAERHPSAA
ncbi:hypothetical protein [Nocardia sp. NPDC005825]|uniref:hypothetical protein n=1 Tax=unclassified Nocardia TaxID=2637762 RepID=UPI0033D1B95E